MHSTILQRKKRTNDLSPNYRSFFCIDIVEWRVDYMYWSSSRSNPRLRAYTTKVLSTWYCHFLYPHFKRMTQIFCIQYVHCIVVLLFRCGRGNICKNFFPLWWYNVCCVSYILFTFYAFITYICMLCDCFTLLYIKYYIIQSVSEVNIQYLYNRMLHKCN